MGSGVQVWMQTAPPAVSHAPSAPKVHDVIPLSSHWEMYKECTVDVFSLGSSDQPASSTESRKIFPINI